MLSTNATGTPRHSAGALEESDYLLLLASPQAAASKWVNQEVEWFLRNRTADRVLIVITGGQVAWGADTGEFDWTHTTALFGPAPAPPVVKSVQNRRVVAAPPPPPPPPKIYTVETIRAAKRAEEVVR